MAKAKRATAAKATAKQEAVQVRIVVDLPPDTPTYYVNHFEVAVNKHEIALWPTRLPTKPGRSETALAEETGEIVVEPEMQILMPPTLLVGLLKAFQKAQEVYESSYGKITEVPE